MGEMVPVMAGAMIGLLIPRVEAPRWRAWALTFLSVVCGSATSWISGELAMSRGYLAIDTAQVALAGMLTWALAARWQSGLWRRPDLCGRRALLQ
jgi:hypothetical protein